MAKGKQQQQQQSRSHIWKKEKRKENKIRHLILSTTHNANRLLFDRRVDNILFNSSAYGTPILNKRVTSQKKAQNK